MQKLAFFSEGDMASIRDIINRRVYSVCSAAIRASVDIAAIWSFICNRRELILVCYLIRYELA